MLAIFSEIERLITERGSAAILRDRLELAKEQYADLEKKNAELQSANDKLRKELEQLQQEVSKLKKLIPRPGDHQEKFTEETNKVLLLFFNLSGEVSADQITIQTGIDRSMVEYHFDLLDDAGFITLTQFATEDCAGSLPSMFQITPDGRKYVVSHGLQQAH